MLRKEEIAEKLQAYYQAVDSGDLKRLFSLFHEDIVYLRGQRTIEGLEAFRAFYRQGRAIREGKHTLHQILIEPPEAAVRGRFSGRLKDGEPVQVDFVDFFWFEGDKIIRRETYFRGREV